MAEISYWNDVYSREIELLAQMVSSLSSTRESEKAAQIAACDEKLKRIKDLKQGFVTEKRLIRDKALKAQYDTKEQEYEESVTKLITELKWAKTEGDKSKLFAGSRGHTEGKTNDDYLSATHTLQDQTEASLMHTKQMIENTKEVGQATLEELHRQRDQINDITEDVMQIDSNLARAEKLIKTFGARMMTDKVIQCFALLNVIALLVVLIYVGVNGGSLTSKSKSPSSPSRRLLRGLLMIPDGYGD